MRCQTRHALRSFLAGLLKRREGQAISPSESQPAVSQTEGVIEQVDPINRELTLNVEDELVCFYVPLNCPVVLNHERVKLRLLQPLDRAAVQYMVDRGTPVALSISVSYETRPTARGAAADDARALLCPMEYT